MPSLVATATVSHVEPTSRTKDHKKGVEQGPASVTESKEETDQFFWTYTEEPHKTRRQEIIKAHPEVGSMHDVVRRNR